MNAVRRRDGEKAAKRHGIALRSALCGLPALAMMFLACAPPVIAPLLEAGRYVLLVLVQMLLLFVSSETKEVVE